MTFDDNSLPVDTSSSGTVRANKQEEASSPSPPWFLNMIKVCSVFSNRPLESCAGGDHSTAVAMGCIAREPP